MNKKVLKKLSILTVALVLAGYANFASMPAMGAGNASLSLGTATLRNGCPGSIPIKINTEGESVLAADVALKVSGQAVVDSLTLGSVLPMQSCSDTSVPDIMLCGARQAGSIPFSGQGTYGTINVTPGSTGTLGFDFDTEKTVIISDTIEDVLGETTGADYQVAPRFNVEVDGVGFCTPDTTAPSITVTPGSGQNNVPVDTSVTLSLSDNRVGVNLSTLTFSVGGVQVDTFSYTKTGGTYKPATPFEEGEKVNVEVHVCDLESNCRDYSGNFRTTPPAPPPNCGDEIVNEDEECDEGGQTATCDRDCTFVACGDGIINDVAGEQCDDLNAESGDGCSANCALETPVEDQTYCPVYAGGIAETCPLVAEALEGEPEEVPTEEGEEAPPEEEFEEEDFAEAATSAVAEAPLRPAAKTVILPATAEKQEEIDPCILRYGTEGASLDHDEDGLSDRTECYSETDPVKQDTDGDTCFDGEEINRFFTDPLVADCSISDYVEAEVLITDPKPNWILTSLEISGSAPRRSLTVGITAFPAIQKTFSKVLKEYEAFLNILKRDVDPENAVAAQQKTGDTTDAITSLQAAITETEEFVEKYPENYEDFTAEIKRVTSFLDGGVAAVSSELEQAKELSKALDKLKTKSIFLGEVNDLQVVGVGNTTTAGFNLVPRIELEDGVYDLVATAGFADGGTKSSEPVRINLSTTIDVAAPVPQTLDGIPIGVETIITKNKRPVLSGKTEYGATVFATWESLVLESSIISDSTEGNFDVQPPRELTTDEKHTVTMYAVTELDGGLVRSKNTTVNFLVEETAEASVYLYTIGFALFLLLLGGLNYALSRQGRKKSR